MKIKLICILSLVFLIFSASSYAGTGRTVAQLLSLGGGTRAAGMGDSFTAVSGDVTSVFWNPSGLADISEMQINMSYMTYDAMFGEASEGMYYGLAAFAMPIKDWGVFGTSLQIFDKGSMLITTNSPDPVDEADLGMDLAWAFCYADELTKNLNAGVSTKIIYQKLWNKSDTAYAVDMGVQYGLEVAPVNIGVALQNLGTGIQMVDEYQTEPLPRNLKFGLAVRVLDMPSHRLQITSDYTSFIDKLRETDEDKKNPDFNSQKAGVGIHAFRSENSQKGLGAEYWYSNILGLRIGYRLIPDRPDNHLTVGFSIRYSNYQFDYAMLPKLDNVQDAKPINLVSLLLRF